MPTLAEMLFIDVQTASQYKDFSEVPENVQKLWAKQLKQSYRDQLIAGGVDIENIPSDWLSAYYRNKASLHAEFAKIVAVSVGKFVFEKGENEAPTLKVQAITGDEKRILTVVSGALSKVKAACAHGGKRFDFPYFARRCVINGLPVPTILDVRNTKPWDVLNVDTQDLWRFGDTSYASLELLCSTLGIPFNSEFDGSMVNDAYYANEINKVIGYSNRSLVATARVYVKLMSGLQISDENIQVF